MLNKWYLNFNLIIVAIQITLFPLLFIYENNLIEPFFIGFAVFVLVVWAGLFVFYLRIPKRKKSETINEFDERLISRYLGKTKVVTKGELIAVRRRNVLNLVLINTLVLIVPVIVYFLNIF